MSVTTAPFRPVRLGGCLDAAHERRADGALVLRSTEPLANHPPRLMDRLVHWAAQAPERSFVAQREKLASGAGRGDWVHISYARMLERARAVGQALVDRGLSAERPVVILSDNDLDHLTLAMGALWAGVPHASISAAYSLVSQDFAKLRHILGALNPGLVFVSQGEPFSRAIEAVVGADVEVVAARGSVPGRRVTPFAELLATVPGAGVDAAHAATGPDTIAKFMFTSGSTKAPKGVIVTNRMWCANQQMLRQSFAFMADEPPVLVDWLPWNHTFGGNHNVGLVLYNGGTLYIDDGKPTPNGIQETLRNLREISPTAYFNVPKGFEEIAAAMDDDAALRDSLFRRVQILFYAGAGLLKPTWDAVDRHAVAATGQRIRMLSGLGMTEAAPSCTFALRPDAGPGNIGLPCPGVEVKLVPMGDKTEVRFRGPNLMPGYWREPELSREAFDEEGFYCTGDAVKLADPAEPSRGLMFDGRIAEDFKLSSGTFVSVGPLKARIVHAGDPCVLDAVIAGINRDDIGVLLFPRLDACRRLAGQPDTAPAAEVLDHPRVREFFQALADSQWRAGTGSANRVARLHVLREPPSIDRGEITDKGSINQRAVLTHRAALVESLYDGSIDGLVVPRT